MSLFMRRAGVLNLRLLRNSSQHPRIGVLVVIPRMHQLSKGQFIKPFSKHALLFSAHPQPQNDIQPIHEQLPSPSPHQPQPQKPFNTKTAKIVVGSIIVSCSGVWILQQYKQSQDRVNPTQETRRAIEKIRQNWILTPQNIREGRYYTMISSAFMHANVLHLGVNMYALWGFGAGAIMVYGYPGFFGLYLSSAIAASAGQLLAYKWRGQEDSGVVGASGAICGLFAAFAFALPFHQMRLMFVPMEMITGLSVWTLFSIGGVQGLWAQNLGHGAHLGGTAIGVLWWFVVMRRNPLGPVQYAKWFKYTMARLGR